MGPRPRRRRGRGSGLAGPQDQADFNTAGSVPGIIGDVGRGARKAVVEEDPQARVFGSIPVDSCPDWFNRYCFQILSRFLEETFRNFQVTARPPSHIAPPFNSTPIDSYPSGVVAIPGGVTTFTTVTSFQVPATRTRGEIVSAGQSAESAAAFSDLAWRITVNGTPFPPWNDIRIQLWEMAPPTKLCSAIHLLGGETIALQARSLSANSHSVLGRLCGWHYQVRSEAGNEVKSTLVD